MKNTKKIINFDDLSSEEIANIVGFNSEYEASMNGEGKFVMPTNPKSITLTFKMVAGSANKTLRLFPGIEHDPGAPANGVMRTAAVGSEFASTEGTAAQFSGSGDPQSPEKLIAFIRRNPSRLAGVKVKSTDATQLEQRFKISKESPFNHTDKTRSISIADFVNENNFNDKVATVPLNEQMDDQTVLDIVVVPGSTLTLTFYFDDIYNAAAEFNSQYQG